MKRVTLVLVLLLGVLVGAGMMGAAYQWVAPAVVATIDSQSLAAQAAKAVVTAVSTPTEVAKGAASAVVRMASPSPVATVEQDSNAPIAASAQVEDPGLTADEQVITRVYEQARPGVVSIMVRGAARVELPQDLPLPDLPQRGVGSGFVIDKQGHILTNNHVVADATELTVTFADGTRVAGKVVGQDPGSDLAVVKVDVAADKLVPLPLGDSDKLKPGQMAIAIGNPLGLDGSVTTGIVSGLARDITSIIQRPIRDVIQTDASINPGNSGGPLLNSRGEVIGINTAIERSLEGGSGVGFAVPINTAKLHLPAMLAGKRITHPWLGIRGVALGDLEPSDLSKLNLPPDLKAGVYVVEVTPDSPADKAGIKGANPSGEDSGLQLGVEPGGDVITQVDDVPVARVQEIVRYLDSKQVGDKVTLTVVRDGRTQTIDVTLGEWPEA